MTTTSQQLLQADKLFCERDDRILFNELSLTVEAGEIVQIEGPNGSGKTTLLRILSGLSANYEGDIFWRGEPRSRVEDQFRAETLFLGHQAGVKALLTPEENLTWLVTLHPALDASLEARAEALAAVGLHGFEDVPCHTLSAGQNRRVSLARLYLSRAPLWILDEPFTAIDKQGVAEQEALLAAQVARGGSVVMTTHQDLSDSLPVRCIRLGDEH